MADQIKVGQFGEEELLVLGLAKKLRENSTLTQREREKIAALLLSAPVEFREQEQGEVPYLSDLTEDRIKRIFIATKLQDGHLLTRKESNSAGKIIFGGPIETRGRKAGSEESIRQAEIYDELRPQCASDIECYRQMLEHEGRTQIHDAEIEALRKRVKYGRQYRAVKQPLLPAACDLDQTLWSYVELALQRLNNPPNGNK